MRKFLVLLVIAAFGFALMGAGCPKAKSITASDGTSTTSIKVDWVWTVPSGGHVVLLRSDTTPLPSAIWNVKYTGTAKTYTDTAVTAGKAYFYKLEIWNASAMVEESWPEGGNTGIGKNPTDANGVALLAKLVAWEKAGNCIHVYTELLHPNPASEMPIHQSLPGNTGTLQLDMVLLGANLAEAEFTFDNFNWTCTNNITVDGYQYAPVNPTKNYNGTMRGYSEYADGWQTYELVVTNKHSSGGIWYVGDDTHGIAVFDYAKAVWIGCGGCSTPASCLCP
jgi:hypothetical protein